MDNNDKDYMDTYNTQANSRPVVAAAKWWTDLLRKGAEWDNGDDRCNAFTSTLSSVFPKAVPTETQLETFYEALKANLKTTLRSDGTTQVYVDYHAPDVLMDAATSAGINANGMTTFGCKTCMWITPHKVSVSQGYGAPEKTIWKNFREEK